MAKQCVRSVEEIMKNKKSLAAKKLIMQERTYKEE